ncbi:hypothetical protein SDC9_178670 [bioreactor metagenome]|uniref:Uncharacterized protein n=1 Tax=bioreactor metagenome TaxID=1076179 RepID=A0A645GY66_9ZZZZ
MCVYRRLRQRSARCDMHGRDIGSPGGIKRNPDDFANDGIQPDVCPADGDRSADSGSAAGRERPTQQRFTAAEFKSGDVRG